MSRGIKSKIALPPGTKLDWDNPDHARHIADEAFAEDVPPRPTKKAPKRMRSWWFWRWFGLFLYRPIRAMLKSYLAARWVDGRGSRHDGTYVPGHYAYRWLGAQALDEWMEAGPTIGSRATWLRGLVSWFAEDRSWNCPLCGFTEFGEDYVIYHEDGSHTNVDLFEHMEGGGLDHFGEAEDYSGWQWCYRCGSVHWETH